MNQDLLKRQKELFKLIKLPALEEKAVEVMIAQAFRDGIKEGLERGRVLGGLN